MLCFKLLTLSFIAAIKIIRKAYLQVFGSQRQSPLDGVLFLARNSALRQTEKGVA